MYSYQSEQRAAIRESAVILDLRYKGWSCEEFSRDSKADIVVDRGKGTVEMVQVKPIVNSKIPTITRKEREGGRNTELYRDFGIHWIAGHDWKTRLIYYYHIDTYGPLNGKDIDIRKIPPNIFPEWIPPLHTNGAKEKKTEAVKDAFAEHWR